MFNFFKNNKKNMQDEQLLQEQELENATVENTTTEENIENVESEPEDTQNHEFAELKAELRKLQNELAEEKELHLRLQADFVNFRKRKEKEMIETISFANEGLMKQLLPVLDDFDRTLIAIEKTDNLTVVKDGIGMVSRNMNHILNKIGLSAIEAKGQPFNADIHEAITTVPVADEAQKDLIFDEIEKGYKLKDKVIRVAKVVVGE
jgi:molecular chaperone GrpE